jgi:hypothetical protein
MLRCSVRPLCRLSFPLLTVAVVFALPTCAAAQKELGQPTMTGPAPPQVDSRGTDAAPLVVRTIESQEQTERATSNQRWTLALAGLTLLLTFGQLVLITVQASIARRQNAIIEQQNQILHRQLKEAEVAAGAAMKSADIAGQSLALAERGYLSIPDVPVSAFVETVSFTALFKNQGRTPIYIKSGLITFDMKPAFPPHAKAPLEHSVEAMTVFPDTQVQVSLQFGPTTPEQRAAWSASESMLYLTGYIDYHDAFPGTRVHRLFLSRIRDGRTGTYYNNPRGQNHEVDA